MGAMAPASVPAALVQQTAEALAGLALTQLVRPGAPVDPGLVPLPHRHAVRLARVRRPGVGDGPVSARARSRAGSACPWRAGGGFLTSSQTADAQAAYEGLNTMLPAFLAGANYVEHAAGWLESGLVACYEKFIVDIEMLRMLQEEFTPLEVDEASLAYGAHQEVGHGGHFLGAVHTLERFRDCFYRPLLSSTENYERWKRNGGRTPPPAARRDLAGDARALRAAADRRRPAGRARGVRRPAAARSSAIEDHRRPGYRQQQPFADGTYSTAGGSAEGFDSLIVAVDTDEGVTGWGEMAPLGRSTPPAFASGARAGIAELAPALLGADAVPAAPAGAADGRGAARPALRQVGASTWPAGTRPPASAGSRSARRSAAGSASRSTCTARCRRLAPRGHGRARPALRGRRLPAAAGQGRRRSALDAQRLAAVRDAVGPDVVLFADANGGWTTASALRFVLATAGVDHALEQPCATLEECAALRRALPPPAGAGRVDRLAGRAVWRRARRHRRRRHDQDRPRRRRHPRRDAPRRRGRARHDGHGRGHGRRSIDTAAMLAPLASPRRSLTGMHTVDFNAWVTVDNGDGMPRPRGRAAGAAVGARPRRRRPRRGARRPVLPGAVTSRLPARPASLDAEDVADGRRARHARCRSRGRRPGADRARPRRDRRRCWPGASACTG